MKVALGIRRHVLPDFYIKNVGEDASAFIFRQTILQGPES